MDKHTGELFAKGFIDRESKENYNFEVTVSMFIVSRASVLDADKKPFLPSAICCANESLCLDRLGYGSGRTRAEHQL